MSKLDLRGLELTTMGTTRQGRMLEPDHEVLALECPREADTGVARTIGRLLGWDETRIEAAVSDGLRAGVFKPRD
jgi:hypothetical protein